MNTDELATAVSEALRVWGFHVDPIPAVHTAKRPDLRATVNDETYLIEVKAKHDNEVQQQEVAAAHSRGEQALVTHELSPRDTIDSKIRQAVSQIAAHPEADTTFHILWYSTEGWHAGVYFEQIEATLYGSATIIDRNDPTWRRTCFFFHESPFYRFRHLLDAAVLTCGQRGKLCFNPYSPHLDRLRASHLAKCFTGGILDPLQLEAADQLVIANCSADRGDEGAVLTFLEAKLGRSLTTMVFRQASVSFTVPAP